MGDVSYHRHLGHRDHPHTSTTLSTRYWHSPQSASPLAETWELPSLSRHACIPLQQAPPVQDNTVPSHTPLLDVRPRGRNQDKLCVTVLPLTSSSGTRKHAAFTSWDLDPRVRTPTELFNLALLARQAWRVLLEPETLSARVLKAVYFPEKHFLEAEVGSSPSWIWRAIMEGK